MVGLQVQQGAFGIRLTQATYISKMLEELGLVDTNPGQLLIAGGEVKSIKVYQDPKLVNLTAYHNVETDVCDCRHMLLHCICSWGFWEVHCEPKHAPF